jgi:hypothetical protein
MRAAPQVAVQLRGVFEAADDDQLLGGKSPSARTRSSFALLQAADAVILWANARDSAWRVYERFGFAAAPGSGYTPPETGRPHSLIELALT